MIFCSHFMFNIGSENTVLGVLPWSCCWVGPETGLSCVPQNGTHCSIHLVELQPPLCLVPYALMEKQIKTENNIHIWSLINVHGIAANITARMKIKCATETGCRSPLLHNFQINQWFCWKEESFIQTYGNMRTPPKLKIMCKKVWVAF